METTAKTLAGTLSTPIAVVTQGLMILCLLLPALSKAESVSTETMPTVMVVLQEKVMGVFNTTGWEVPTQAEVTLIEQLRNSGFDVVDPQSLRLTLARERAQKMLESDNRSAASVGLQQGSQISILGTAISKPAGAKLHETQMQSIQATVTARVIKNDTAAVIATASATAAKAHIDEVQGGTLALEAATLKLAEELIPKITAELSVSAGDARTLLLTISGLKSYRHLDYILYFFETKVKGVSGVYLDEFTNNVARLRLDYSDQSPVLARKVAKEKFRGFRLEPMEVTANRMDLSVVGE